MLDVLTKFNGKICIKVPGIGKPKSRFSNLNTPGLLCYGLAYLSREHANLSLTDVEIINDYSSLKTTPNASQCISYITSFLAAALPEKLRVHGLLDSVELFLQELSSCPDISLISYTNLFRFFVMRKLGYLPDLLLCMNCNKKLKQNAFLTNLSNEILCCECAAIEEKNNFFHFFELHENFINYYNNIYFHNASISDLIKTNNEKYNKTLEIFLEYFIIKNLKYDIKLFSILKKILLEFSN